jgi:hypothetical protein
LGVQNKKNISAKKKQYIRYRTHFFISSLIILTIVLFREINNQAVIDRLFTIAGYTYGPLLGLFAFGMFTHLEVKDKYVPVVALLAPILSYLLSDNSKFLLNGYVFGFEILIVNGLLTFIGLLIIQKKHNN